MEKIPRELQFIYKEKIALRYIHDVFMESGAYRKAHKKTNEARLVIQDIKDKHESIMLSVSVIHPPVMKTPGTISFQGKVDTLYDYILHQSPLFKKRSKNSNQPRNK